MYFIDMIDLNSQENLILFKKANERKYFYLIELMICCACAIILSLTAKNAEDWVIIVVAIISAVAAVVCAALTVVYTVKYTRRIKPLLCGWIADITGANAKILYGERVNLTVTDENFCLCLTDGRGNRAEYDYSPLKGYGGLYTALGGYLFDYLNAAYCLALKGGKRIDSVTVTDATGAKERTYVLVADGRPQLCNEKSNYFIKNRLI